MKKKLNIEEINHLKSQIYMTGKWIAILEVIKMGTSRGFTRMMRPCIKIQGAIKIDGALAFGAIYSPHRSCTVEIPLYLSKDKLPQVLQILIDDLKEQKAKLEQELEKLKKL